jgi:hypothetical protein
VPYYRQLLPIFNIYHEEHVNLGDGMHYGQRRKDVLGELIAEVREK